MGPNFPLFIEAQGHDLPSTLQYTSGTWSLPITHWQFSVLLQVITLDPFGPCLPSFGLTSAPSLFPHIP